jgi:hypothetical protein
MLISGLDLRSQAAVASAETQAAAKFDISIVAGELARLPAVRKRYSPSR